MGDFSLSSNLHFIIEGDKGEKTCSHKKLLTTWLRQEKEPFWVSSINNLNDIIEKYSQSWAKVQKNQFDASFRRYNASKTRKNARRVQC